MMVKVRVSPIIIKAKGISKDFSVENLFAKLVKNCSQQSSKQQKFAGEKVDEHKKGMRLQKLALI